MKPRLYLIPGMGTDHRVFQFLDLKNYDLVVLDFPEPQKKESLSDYSMRMAESIPEDETPVLIGLSMGGFVAQEIAAKRRISKVILISSTRDHKNWISILNLIRNSGLIELLPNSWIKEFILNAIRFMGIPKRWKTEFIEMANTFSPEYYYFASHELLNWKGAAPRCEVIHIHGTRDELFPIDKCNPDILIEGGTHLMIATHANKISEAIERILEQ